MKRSSPTSSPTPRQSITEEWAGRCIHDELIALRAENGRLREDIAAAEARGFGRAGKRLDEAMTANLQLSAERDAVRAEATFAEREACANIADNFSRGTWPCKQIAAAIRGRQL